MLWRTYSPIVSRCVDQQLDAFHPYIRKRHRSDSLILGDEVAHGLYGGLIYAEDIGIDLAAREDHGNIVLDLDVAKFKSASTLHAQSSVFHPLMDARSEVATCTVAPASVS